MKSFDVKCQVNANRETVIVVVPANNLQHAWARATEVVNSRK